MGLDTIDTRTTIIIHHYIIKLLKLIINVLFTSGTLLSQFRQSVVTPSNENDINKCKLTTAISNFSKIFEECLK